jgi:hypothetical protein
MPKSESANAMERVKLEDCCGFRFWHRRSSRRSPRATEMNGPTALKIGSTKPNLRHAVERRHGKWTAQPSRRSRVIDNPRCQMTS